MAASADGEGCRERPRLSDCGFKKKQAGYCKKDNFVWVILMTSYRRGGVPPPAIQRVVVEINFYENKVVVI